MSVDLLAQQLPAQPPVPRKVRARRLLPPLLLAPGKRKPRPLSQEFCFLALTLRERGLSVYVVANLLRVDRGRITKALRAAGIGAYTRPTDEQALARLPADLRERVVAFAALPRSAK
jgi:hypothetical protein